MATSYNFTIVRGSTFRGFLIHCKDQSTGQTLPLTTGYIPYAQIRKKLKLGATEITDLLPVISDVNGGLVTIPPIADTDTVALVVGNWPWDFILQLPSGERTEPLAAGTVTIIDKASQPPF